MWRDRTNLYISYRQSYGHHPAKRARFSASNDYSVDESRRGLLSSSLDDIEPNGSGGPGSGDVVIEMDRLPPRWADIPDEVTELLSEINRMSNKLDKLHAKHVLPGFDDNRSAEEGEIERLTTDITTKFHQCQAAIKKVERMAKGAGRTEEVMSKNLQISLATKVQQSSTAFRKKQAAYLKRLRGLGGITPPLERSASPMNPSFMSSSLLDEENDVSYSRSALQQSATLTSNDNAILQREREITDIANGIIELADIFKELQSMVIDHGTLLDRIDYNVEIMRTEVKAAEKELVQASGYQKRTTKRKAILLLLICIAGLIIILTLKPSRSDDSGGVQHPALPPPSSNDDGGIPGLNNPGGGNRINHPGGDGGKTGDPDATLPEDPKPGVREAGRRKRR